MISAKCFIICLPLTFGILSTDSNLSLNSARANICAEPRLDVGFPLNKSEDVPINTRIWVPDIFPRTAAHSMWLQIENDPQRIPLTIKKLYVQGNRIEAPYLYVLHPKELLQANTRYELYIRGILNRAFTTNSHIDLEAPSPPQILDQSAFNFRDAYGDHNFGARFNLEHQGILTLIDGDQTDDLDLFLYSGRISGIERDMSVFFGNAHCTFTWPSDVGHQPGDQASVRFGTMDLAGNFSGWTPEQTVVIPPKESEASCSLLSSSRSVSFSRGAWITILFTAFFLQQRLRRHNSLKSAC